MEGGLGGGGGGGQGGAWHVIELSAEFEIHTGDAACCRMDRKKEDFRCSRV